MKALRIISYALMKRSIKKYGQIVPILVDRNGVVLDGNRRLTAARELGIMVPCVRIDAEVEMIDPKELIVSCPVRLRGSKQ